MILVRRTLMTGEAPPANVAPSPSLDLPAYCERIGYAGTFGLSFPAGTRFRYRVPAA